MPDYFQRFGTTTAQVTTWAATMNKVVTLDSIATASGAADSERPLPQRPGDGKTTREWKARFGLKKEPDGRIRLKNYKEGGVLGQGSQGVVRRLQKPGSPPLVGKFVTDDAVKAGLTDEFLEFLKNEAKVYEQLGDHPNIPKCLGIVSVGDKEALVLEAVEGNTWTKTLDDLQERYSSKGGNLSHEEYWGAVQYTTAKLLQTLAFIESKGMVHCDIKPDNLMIDKNGELKVIDLGGAVAKGNNITDFTKDYAPVQNSGEELKKASGAFDVFSTGTIAAEFAEGKPGFEAEYARLCKWLTAPNPGKRPSAKDALKHPFFAQTLLDEEKARQVLSDIEVTPGFDQFAFKKTISKAVALKKIKIDECGGSIVRVHSLLRMLAEPAAQFEKLGEAKAKLEAMKRASKLLEDLIAALKELSTAARGALKGYLAGMSEEAAKRKKDIESMPKSG